MNSVLDCRDCLVFWNNLVSYFVKIIYKQSEIRKRLQSPKGMVVLRQTMQLGSIRGQKKDLNMVIKEGALGD